METQKPLTVAQAATYAMIQEGVLERVKFQSKQSSRKHTASGFKQDYRAKYGPGDLWKTQQLKEYCRANGLCLNVEKNILQRISVLFKLS